jgi:Mg-chelatase subunit ChlD
MPSAFISYRRAESSMLATLLDVRLREKFGIELFIDARDDKMGGSFPTRLLKAIEDRDVFICLLGRETLTSEWVQKEIEHAHNLGKPMIPIFQESFEAPSQPVNDALRALLESDGIHVLDRKNIYVDESIEKLAKMIIKLAGKSSSETPRPIFSLLMFAVVAAILGALVLLLVLSRNQISPLLSNADATEQEATLAPRTPTATALIVMQTVTPVEQLENLNFLANERIDADVLFVVDTSTSMMASNKMIAVSEAIDQFVDALRSNDRIGLITFNSTVQIDIELTPVSEIGNTFKMQLASIVPFGQTSLYDALSVAIDESERLSLPDRVLILILLSDGMDDGSQNTLDEILFRISTFRLGSQERIVIPISYSDSISSPIADVSLVQIADASQTQVIPSTPDSIDIVIERIASYLNSRQ